MDSSNPADDTKKRLSRGGRNLIILGVVATVVSLGLTTASLAIYHYSGDIYLDRSRPGYLPDIEEAEIEEETEEGDFKFEKTGSITKEALDEYLKKMQIEVEALDVYRDPFDKEALSDEQFGLQNE